MGLAVRRRTSGYFVNDISFFSFFLIFTFSFFVSVFGISNAISGYSMRATPPAVLF